MDGLRAFAALWVVVFHMRSFSGGRAPSELDLLARSGSTGVSLFLVLSGFCLYLPYAGGRSSRFRAGHFFRRRWARLVPTYYTSIAVIILAIVVTSGRIGLPRMGVSSLAQQAGAHLTLVQQLFPSTFYGLNGAYWSLGLEWELYLTLPILLWAARRWGVPRVVGAVVGVNVLYRLALAAIVHAGLVAAHGSWATDVLPNLFPGRWAEFAFGLWAAELYATGRVASWARWSRWTLIGLVPLGFAIAGDPLAHLVFGLVFFAALCLVLTSDNVVNRFFSWAPFVMIGTISYSIYLVHTPVLEVEEAWLRGLGWSPNHVFLGMILLLPAVLLAAWLLFVAVERRSLSPSTLASTPGSRLLSPKLPTMRGFPARRTQLAVAIPEPATIDVQPPAEPAAARRANR